MKYVVLSVVVLLAAESALNCFAEEDLETLVFKAEAGDPYFQAVLGEVYRRGEMGLKINYPIAARLLKSSAEKKHALGIYNLAVLYEQGHGVQQDTNQAAVLYKRCAKGLYKIAASGDARALFNLGVMYKDGKAVERNPAKALVCFRKASDKGNPQAEYTLASMYLQGEGVSRDAGAALGMYEKLADQGFAPAQLALARMYQEGEDVEQDIHKALQWYSVAAEAGDPAAQYSMGLLCYSGKGLPANIPEAAKWFKRAAEQGHAPSQYNLAALYYAGNGVVQDRVQAEKWFLRAGEQGHAASQYNLALMYLQNETTDEHRQEVITWLEKAADQGHAKALRKLQELGYRSIFEEEDPPEHAEPQSAKEPERPLVVFGFHLGMDLDEACILLKRHAGRPCRTKKLSGRRGYSVPFDRTRDLLLTDLDKKVTQISFPGEIVDELFKADGLPFDEFVTAFADSMGIEEWDEAPEGADRSMPSRSTHAVPTPAGYGNATGGQNKLSHRIPRRPALRIHGQRWVYRTAAGEELILYGDRSMTVRKSPAM